MAIILERLLTNGGHETSYKQTEIINHSSQFHCNTPSIAAVSCASVSLLVFLIVNKTFVGRFTSIVNAYEHSVGCTCAQEHARVSWNNGLEFNLYLRQSQFLESNLIALAYVPIEYLDLRTFMISKLLSS